MREFGAQSYLYPLNDCVLCPRECHVNRRSGDRGYCGATDEMFVARAALHIWEEPPISAERGSGTVFFSCCSLRCVYCQNASISSGLLGKAVSAQRLAEIFLALQEQGAHNINLVTPAHYVCQIIEAIKKARIAGLSLPIVYNTSGYESIATLQMLEGYVDVYLTDFKYWDPVKAKRYSLAANYPSVAKRAIKAMVDQVGEVVYDNDSPARLVRGTLVRHLLLPGAFEDAKQIVHHLHENYGTSIAISLMSQYTPQGENGAFPELSAQVSPHEYEELLDFADNLGIEDYCWQKGNAASISFIPAFDCTGV